MRTIGMAMALAVSALSAIPAAGQETEEAMLTEDEYAEAHAILSGFVEDYRTDPMAISATFGTSYPQFMEDLNQFYREYPFVRSQPSTEEEGGE